MTLTANYSVLASRQLARISASRSAASRAPSRRRMTTSAEAAATKDSPTKQKFELISAGKGAYKVDSGGMIAAATAGVYPLVRLGSAAFVSGNLAQFRSRPKQPIILYEFQGCPFCTKVREATTILDLDVLFYPTPKGGPTWRPKAVAESGKSQFPYMVDPNTGRKMLESDAIIEYLYQEYGDGKVPLQLRLGALTALSIGVGLLPRGGRGSSYRPSNLPEKPLDIWGYEASPFVKLSREVLNELEIPHVFHSVARNSPKRIEMTEKWGSFQVPYLEDPNTGKALFESGKINEYLEETYAKK